LSSQIKSGGIGGDTSFLVAANGRATVIPTACAGAIIAGPVERAIARKILAAKILVSRFIVFSSWRHQ
jgi:hypothetical protein